MRTKATPAPALVLQGDEIAAGFTTSGRPHAAADTAAAMPINSANDSAIPALHSRPAAIKKWFQQKGRHIAVRIFAIILAASLWQVASANEWNFLLNFENIPTPVTVGNEFVEQLQNPTFYTHLGVSIKRILIAYVLAALLGIFLGVLMGRYAVVEDIFIPYIEILRPIPAVAWIPLSILMLPTEESSIIFITFLGALFPIVLNTLHGVEQTPSTLVRAARSFGASDRAILWHVIIPGAMPSIVAGLAIGMGVAWFSLLAGEIISGQYGIGYFTWTSYQMVEYPHIIIGMLMIGALGTTSTALVKLAAKPLLRWQSDKGSR